MKTSTALWSVIITLAASLLLVSCGGSSSTPPPPPPVYYSIGGTMSNLASGDSVQLQDNGGDTLSVNANGSFTFATKLTSGSSYKVTISAQPASPAQTCGLSNGTGTATSNVTSVAVDCGHNEWAWMSGGSKLQQAGVYGTKGTAGPGNTPGARQQPVTWTDSSGNFWLFGGAGYDSAGYPGPINDLWKYSGGQWTWMSGPNQARDRARTGPWASLLRATYLRRGKARSPGSIPLATSGCLAASALTRPGGVGVT